uniref:Triacylglycerol lipase n=1 Tax=Plectus sambesii TaxID=2011161 RepID=A0A914WKW7_9BILA
MSPIISSLVVLLSLAGVFGQSRGPPGPMTKHFLDWLNDNGFKSQNFARSDVGPNGSYGGKKSDTDEIVHQPIIFIHGNGDAALHTQAPLATGWSRSVEYFLEQNYTSAELYTTTWGNAWAEGGHVLDTYNTMHTCSHLMYIRRFIDAVLLYTGAEKIDVISHSLGVPLTRKALKGGTLVATDGNCTLGPALSDKVDSFLGISGPNYGLCACQLAQTVPAWCNALDGLYPGYTCGDQLLCGFTNGNCSQENYSAFLETTNNDKTREAEHVYAMWSDVDEVLLFRGRTWGKETSRIPGMNGRWVSDRNGHVAMKDLTEQRQYSAVVNHEI